MPARPDALILPIKLKSGRSSFARVKSILKVAEPVLQVDRLSGERAHIRRQPDGTLFITRDPFDTLNFPITHDREGQSRYRWEAQPDGSRLGYLVPDADGDPDAPDAPAS